MLTGSMRDAAADSRLSLWEWFLKTCRTEAGVGSCWLPSLPQQCLVVVYSLNPVRFFATPWTIAHQAPLSIGLPRQEYWSGLPFPSSGVLPDPGIRPGSPALWVDSFPTEPPGKAAPSTAVSKHLKTLKGHPKMLSTYQGVKERELLLPPLLLHTQELKNKFQKFATDKLQSC